MKILQSAERPMFKNGNRRSKLREVDTNDLYEYGPLKVVRVKYTDGETRYSITQNNFTWLEFDQDEMDDMIVFLNTLKEDGEI